MTFLLQSKQGTRSIIGTILLLIYLFSNITTVHSSCRNGCDLALASFFVWREPNLPIISKLFENIPINDILDWNTNIANVFSVPFRCDCLNNGEYLGHVFKYNVSANDTYDLIATKYYSNLTNKEWLMRVNSYPEGNIPNNVTLNMTVNCSCGNKDVSKDYGLFITYLMRPGENLASIALATKTSSELIEKYNPMVNFIGSSGLLYITGRGLSGIHVDKSVEFSYEELAESTNDFSISNKIGEGGFVAVYYAELRGKKAAIKRMNRQRRTEFLAELKILVRVHHLNLGETYCHGQQGCKLHWIQPEVLSIYTSTPCPFTSIVILNQQIF